MEFTQATKFIIVHWINFLIRASLGHAAFIVLGIPLYVTHSGEMLIFEYNEHSYRMEASKLSKHTLNMIMLGLTSNGDFSSVER